MFRRECRSDCIWRVRCQRRVFARFHRVLLPSSSARVERQERRQILLVSPILKCVLRSRYQTPILTTVFQLSFLSVYFISSPVGLLGDEIVSFRFRKSIDARAKIAVKYMCMRNYVVTTPGATLRGFNVNAAAIFNVSLSSLIKCPRLITCNLTLNVVTKHFAIHFFFFFKARNEITAFINYYSRSDYVQEI